MLAAILLDQARDAGLPPAARLVLAVFAAAVLICVLAFAIVTRHYDR